jgi:hypothetical protein
MSEWPVIATPPGEETTALDAVQQLTGALAELFEETDRRAARGDPAPLEHALACGFMPGVGAMLRGVAQIGREIADERERALGFISEAECGSPLLHGPSACLMHVLRLAGILDATAAVLRAALVAAELEAIGLDRATAALCTGTAFVDRLGRIVARTNGVESPAET